MLKTVLSSPIWLRLFEVLLVLSLGLSSFNGKAMGMAWLLLILAGLWSGVQSLRSGPSLQAPIWVRIWLGVALAVLILKSLPTLYWSDPWAERHGELRLFWGALGIYLLVASPLIHRRQSIPNMAYALTWSSLLGLVWVSLYGRDEVFTHPIPWAGGMAMVSAWLLALGLKSNFSLLHRRIWLIGGLFAMLAVLASRSRGAFGIVGWWALVCGHHLWCHRTRPTGQAPWRSVGLQVRSFLIGTAVLAATCWALSYTPVLQRPIQAVHEAIAQIAVSKVSPEAGSNSSIGSRIYMWQKSLLAIEASPWLGYGHDGRKQLLNEWAVQADSTEIKQLGHVHNEYLNQLIDHGVWGLASQITLLLGLGWMCWRLALAQEITAALALGGVTFVHLTASFFNVNFAHNFYTASLSTLIGLCLWVANPRVRN